MPNETFWVIFKHCVSANSLHNWWIPPRGTLLILSPLHSSITTVLENHQKCRIIFFWILTIKVACLVTLFDLKLQVFKNSPKLTFFGIFDELFATRNVNEARFARNVLCDFFCNFHTSWLGTWILTLRISHVIDFFSWHTWLFSRRKWIKKSYIFFPFGVKVSSPVLRVLSSTIYFCVQLIFALTLTSTTWSDKLT